MYDFLVNISQEERIDSLEKELKEQKKQIEMLSKWVLFLIEAQGEIELEAHRVN